MNRGCYDSAYCCFKFIEKNFATVSIQGTAQGPVWTVSFYYNGHFISRTGSNLKTIIADCAEVKEQPQYQVPVQHAAAQASAAPHMIDAEIIREDRPMRYLAAESTVPTETIQGARAAARSFSRTR